MPENPMPADPEPSLAESMMRLARSVRLYHLALAAEGFSNSEALALAMAWQMHLLSGTQEPEGFQ